MCDKFSLKSNYPLVFEGYDKERQIISWYRQNYYNINHCNWRLSWKL